MNRAAAFCAGFRVSGPARVRLVVCSGALTVVLFAMSQYPTALPRLAIVLIVSPLAEEVVFRAGLQEMLLRGGGAALMANGVTALTFGIAHALLRADPWALTTAVPALFIGAVYGHRRLVWPCVALHAAMNGVWVLWMWVGSGTGL